MDYLPFFRNSWYVCSYSVLVEWAQKDRHYQGEVYHCAFHTNSLRPSSSCTLSATSCVFLPCQYTGTLSAKLWVRSGPSCWFEMIPTVYTLNSRGVSAEPCGDPRVTVCASDTDALSLRATFPFNSQLPIEIISRLLTFMLTNVLNKIA